MTSYLATKLHKVRPLGKTTGMATLSPLRVDRSSRRRSGLNLDIFHNILSPLKNVKYDNCYLSLPEINQQSRVLQKAGKE